MGYCVPKRSVSNCDLRFKTAISWEKVVAKTLRFAFFIVRKARGCVRVSV